ncbi:MAG: MFS transporter, partial [Spirochaetaceae bacterium]
FQITRGVGLVANSPLMGEISSGRDRGGFLARFSMITAVASIAGGLSVALLLSGDPPLGRYSLLMSAGIVFGFLGCYLITRLPEPSGVSEGAAEGMLPAVRNALAEPNFRRLITSFAVLTALSGAARTFLVVYARQVYAQPDSTTMLYTVIGSTGWMAMGFVARHVIDRLGAKPMLVFYSVVFLASMIPALISPAFSGTTLVIHLGLVFFLATMGFTGGEHCAQTYFYSLIAPKDRLNLGVLFFMTLGLGGSIGSFAGGVLLDTLSVLNVGTVATQFRIFFLVLTALTAVCILLMLRLERLGARSTLSALGVLLSIRDLRTITLLNRLDRTTTVSGQQQVLQEIAGSQSKVALSEILPMLRSPSFAVRTDALEALNRVPVEPPVIEAIVDEINTQEFTTAYIAARIAGVKQIKEARPALRTAMRSADYLLAAKSMVALARMKDRQSIPQMERALEESGNPLVIIHAAVALKILRATDSLHALIAAIRAPQLPRYAADEIILAIAGLLDIEAWFYPLYTAFLADPASAIEMLDDYQNECGTAGSRATAPLRPRSGDVDGDDGSAVEQMVAGDSEALAGAAEALEELRRHTDNRAFDELQDLLEVATIQDNGPVRFLLAAVIVRFGCEVS